MTRLIPEEVKHSRFPFLSGHVSVVTAPVMEALTLLGSVHELQLSRRETLHCPDPLLMISFRVFLFMMLTFNRLGLLLIVPTRCVLTAY